MASSVPWNAAAQRTAEKVSECVHPLLTYAGCVWLTCDLLLECLVQVLSAADEADGAEAEAVAVDGRLGRRLQPLVVGQAEVVVGAEVEQSTGGLGGHRDERTLRAGDHTLILIRAGTADALHSAQRGERR